MSVERLTELYREYVNSFRNADGELPDMMQLKLEHTRKVVENARAIADGEGFSPIEQDVSAIAALLHDTGRYEQLKRYNTFRDSDSIDHAVFSHDIVLERKWLDGDDNADAILKAVLYHNRRDLPDDMDSLTALASHTVRDADKLDIFRVLEDQLAKEKWENGSRAFWNLQVYAPPNPVVVECIEEKRPVDYQNIKSLADFVLIQVGWMISGLHFATSRRICFGRNHLEFRRKFLHRLCDDPAIDRLCGMAEGELRIK